MGSGLADTHELILTRMTVMMILSKDEEPVEGEGESSLMDECVWSRRGGW